MSSSRIEQARSFVAAYPFSGQEQKQATFLTALLDHSLEPDAVAREILDPEHGGKLPELADYYWNNVMVAFRCSGGRTPPPTSHPSRSEDPDPVSEDDGAQLTDPPAARRVQERLQRVVFHADGQRCLVTNKYNVDIKEADEEAGVDEEREYAYLEAAHIVPYACHANEPFLIALHRLAPDHGIPERLLGTRINHPSNVMTLSMEAHRDFGSWRFVIDPEEELRGDGTWGFRFRIHVLRSSLTSRRVITDDTRRVPIHGLELLPRERSVDIELHPLFLRLHAALGRVLLASGRAEELDRIFADREDDEGSQALSNPADTEGVLDAVSARLAVLARAENMGSAARSTNA
ncbi:hypothetical protein DFJ77DRAFT_467209 [Powellomyces hirtus]|nr:hypothetical protein DFJ77DRAFT_467209 [Powellomyces hirtus]